MILSPGDVFLYRWLGRASREVPPEAMLVLDPVVESATHTRCFDLEDGEIYHIPTFDLAISADPL